MQYIAASSKDTAGPSILSSGQSATEQTGSGSEFARVMENSEIKNQDMARSKEESTAGVPADVSQRASNDDGQNATSEEQENHDDVGQEQHSQADKHSSSGDASSDENDDDSGYNEDMHEEWVSIIERLNGQSQAGVGEEVTVPENAGDPTLGPVVDVKAADSETKEQSETADITETDSVAMQGTQPFTGTLNHWKQQLRDKILNSGETFTAQQHKQLETELHAMSDEQVLALLNSDQKLKQMVSDILGQSSPTANDTALLFALAGAHNNGEEAGAAGDAETPEQSAEAETDPLLNALAGASDAAQSIELEPEAESDASSGKPANAEPTIVSTGKNDESGKAQKVSSTESDAQKIIEQLEGLAGNDEQKLVAVENLTRRLESGDMAQSPAVKSFVDSLKSAVAELKEQRKAGHEPAININNLVSDAMAQLPENTDVKGLESQLNSSMQQMVQVTQNYLSLEPASKDNLLNSFQSSLSNKESSVAQLEASKNQQQNQFNQQLDKAINMQKPEAAQDLANKVQVMLNQKNMVADIRLDPPDLGQMQIKIAMQGDSASVSMVVQSQAAREALEHNQPRLKELLEQQGIELGQSSVEQESQGNQSDGDGSNFASGKGQEAAEDIALEEEKTVVSVDEPGGIDYFA